MNSQNTAPNPDASRTTPTFGVIIIGDEILSGKRADKHLPKVIELLGARGLSLSWAEYHGDSPERITAALAKCSAPMSSSPSTSRQLRSSI